MFIVQFAKRGGSIKRKRISILCNTLAELIETEFRNIILTDKDLQSIIYSYEYCYDRGDITDNLRDSLKKHIDYLLEERGYI